MHLQKDFLREVIALAQTQVLGEGKSIEEAIENALAKLQVERTAVDIEVLEKPAKGLFGRRTGKAVVRATLRQPAGTKTPGPKGIGLVSVKNGILSTKRLLPLAVKRLSSLLGVMWRCSITGNQLKRSQTHRRAGAAGDRSAGKQRAGAELSDSSRCLGHEGRACLEAFTRCRIYSGRQASGKSAAPDGGQT